MFKNDSLIVLSQGAKILLYAIDVLLYKPINNFDNPQADTLFIGYLTMNTKGMLISCRHNLAHHTPPLHLNGSLIHPFEQLGP